MERICTMKDNKPWYEKISIWITIIAGICTISAFIFTINNAAGENESGANNIDNNINNVEGNDNIIINAPVGGDVNINTNKPSTSNIQTLETEEIQNHDDIEGITDEQPYPDDYVIIWEDKNFEKFIKITLNKEHITYADIKDITALYIYDDRITIDKDSKDFNVRYRKSIEDISLNDLKYFDSLLRLGIYNYQSINCDIFEDEDFSNRLIALDLCVKVDTDQIKKISKLNSLRGLLIEQNNISMKDLEILSAMDNLTDLILWNNNITDISPISNLRNLTYLDLCDNRITNIDALSNLEILETVLLSGNNITDYSPVSHVETVLKTPEEVQKYFNSIY